MGNLGNNFWFFWMDFYFELCPRMKCSHMLATQRRAIHSMTLWPRWRCVQRRKVKSIAQIGWLYQPLESRTKKNESRDAIVTVLLSLKFCNGRMTWKLALEKFLESTNVLMVLYLYSSWLEVWNLCCYQLGLWRTDEIITKKAQGYDMIQSNCAIQYDENWVSSRCNCRRNNHY